MVKQNKNVSMIKTKTKMYAWLQQTNKIKKTRQSKISSK